MQRAMVITTTAVVLVGAASWLLYQHAAGKTHATEGDPLGGEKVVKTVEQWRQQLSEEEYRVTRKGGTERAYSGRYWNTKEEGTFACVCCGQPLFDSDTKYDSCTGWPSFNQPVREGAVAMKT